MNKLKNEKSAYLQQHVENPVNWYPWGEEAFADARKEGKPILLSIGYSACHWCHVMAHESFEDEETAELMNKNFINIKLDKEERPDLDKIYQMAQTIITGKSGGWPLTVFMTDDKFPFFAGTYFPPEARYGLPAFKQILERVTEFFHNKQHDIKTQNAQIQNIFDNLNTHSDELAEKNINQSTIDLLVSSIDKVHGGFGSAPKFPRCTNLKLLLDNHQKLDKESYNLLKLSIDRMCFSGIYDQVGGGFFRYSVDELWMIPHFEKMLYDNGPLVSIMCDAYRVFGDEIYLKKARETCEWAISDMQNDNGGFSSTIDADSEGKEGKYYVWSDNELNKILDDNELDVFRKVYIVHDKPNFEGNYHLHIMQSNIKEFNDSSNIIEDILVKLKKHRSTRIPPGTDKKILTSWNCLMIKGLLDTYKITNEIKYFESASKSFEFIKNKLWDGDNLYACFHEQPEFRAYLDDYAFLSNVCIEFLKLQWDAEVFTFLMKLVDTCEKNFLDKENGGFFFSSILNKDLIYRPKLYTDESMPSGNSVMIDVLHKIFSITGNIHYKELAESTFNSSTTSLKRSYESHCNIILSVPDYNPRRTIFIKCDKSKLKHVKEEVFNIAKLQDQVFIIDNNTKTGVKNVDDKISKGGFTAYVCEDFVCSEPIIDIKQLSSKMRS